MTTTQNPEDSLPTPVLPDETFEGPPAPVALPPVAPNPPEVISTPHAAVAALPKPAKHLPEEPMSAEEAEKWDYDSWISQWPWDQPNMQCKVERIYPELVGTTQTAGVCGVFDNKGLSSQEIQQMFGGGRYHISVIGPRKTKKGPRIMRLSHKPLKLVGEPNLSNLGRIAQGSTPGGAPATSLPPPRPPAPADGMVRLVDNMTGHLQRRVDQAGAASAQTTQVVSDHLEKAAEMKIEAANHMLAEKDRMLVTQLAVAQKQVDAARNEAVSAHKDKDQAILDARAAQERILSERSLLEDRFTQKLGQVQGDSSNLLATLLPATQASAQQQITSMMTMFESRISAQELSYSNRLEGLERSYEQRMAAQASLTQVQMESTTSLYKGQIQHLQQLLTQAQGEKTLVMTQLEDSRNRLMEQIATLNKAKDPEEAMVKMANMMETVKSIAGVAGGDEAAAGSGNAFFDGIMSNVGKLAEVVPHITGAISAKAQSEAVQAQAQAHAQAQAAQQQVPQLAPPQLQAPQEEEVAPAPQPQRRRAPRRAAPPKKKQGKIARDEMDKAVLYINAALASNPELAPSDFANVALSSVDNDTLRRLSRQKSELVVKELETVGVLHGEVSTENGKVFLCALLDIFREKL